MISIILYGRNDNYGYNLHKRAVISLNCMAEVLTSKNDEILFVDYNTPDDFPTFPEAVYDNLTESCRSKLRVFRVRENIHRRFEGKTRLFTNEPLARNIALRRSNPENRWVLATNTDLIFVPETTHSLSDIVEPLADGIYCAPRIELPETLWEGLDRRDPRECIAAARHWGARFHLNEFVYGNDDIHFDAPGDFQLMLRSALFVNDGFDEGMVAGWHVDYNISKRMRMLYGKVSDLSHSVVGYHCDHTRQITPMHKHGGDENSTDVFVDALTGADIPSQRATWGCPEDAIEEISFKSPPARGYIEILENIINNRLEAPLKVGYREETYGTTTYSPEHLLPFLVDLFYNAPRHWSIGWVGVNARTLDLFSQAWTGLGFSPAHILVEPANFQRLPPGIGAGAVRPATLEEIADAANAIVFDFTTLDGESLAQPITPTDKTFAIDFGRAFRALLAQERKRMIDGQPPRRFIGLNAIHNDFERVIVADVGAARTPFSLRMRHGFVLKDPPPIPSAWLPLMYLGVAGASEGAVTKTSSKGERLTCLAQNAVVTSNGKEGHLVYGPYQPLKPGCYRLVVRIEEGSAVQSGARVIIEAACDARYFAQRDLEARELQQGVAEMNFEILEEDVTSFQLPHVEFRVWTERDQTLILSGVNLERIE